MTKTRSEYQKAASPCCGRKPMVYMQGRPSYPRGQYCSKCSRVYDFDTEQQLPNWAWKLVDGVWLPTYPEGDYAKMPGRKTDG